MKKDYLIIGGIIAALGALYFLNQNKTLPPSNGAAPVIIPPVFAPTVVTPPPVTVTEVYAPAEIYAPTITTLDFTQHTEQTNGGGTGHPGITASGSGMPPQATPTPYGPQGPTQEQTEKIMPIIQATAPLVHMKLAGLI